MVAKPTSRFPVMKKLFSTEIKEIFAKVEIVSSLARKKLIFSFALGLIKSRKVQFCEVAEHLNNKAKKGCNEVRIQDFFRQAKPDYGQLALLLCLFLPRKGKVRLSIDRTEWDFVQVPGQHSDGAGQPGEGAGAALLGASG